MPVQLIPPSIQQAGSENTQYKSSSMNAADMHNVVSAFDHMTMQEVASPTEYALASLGSSDQPIHHNSSPFTDQPLSSSTFTLPTVYCYPQGHQSGAAMAPSQPSNQVYMYCISR